MSLLRTRGLGRNEFRANRAANFTQITYSINKVAEPLLTNPTFGLSDPAQRRVFASVLGYVSCLEPAWVAIKEAVTGKILWEQLVGPFGMREIFIYKGTLAGESLVVDVTHTGAAGKWVLHLDFAALDLAD